MVDIRREGQLIELDGKVRIESGPVRVSAKATEELLANDVTAEHYQEGRIDSLGNPIELGKTMHYLDWHGHNLGNDGSTGFYVYKLEQLTAEELKEREIDPETAEPEQLTIWREKACEPDEDTAMGTAMGLLTEGD